MDTLIGKTLSHYRIVEQIGAGGMGVVYRARDERLDRDVAVKVLPSGALADEASRKRFRKEALTLSKLNHPHVATIYDFDTQEGVDFLVMEYVSGVSLDTRLAGGVLSEKEVARLGSQLAQGLTAAHAVGIIHRDLKPSNLRVTTDSRLKILDFGLAKALHPVRPDLTTTTDTGVVAGTLPYMSPEQLRGEKPDERSDIYSAGVVLYEAATGRRAFPQNQAPQVIDAILREVPPPPRQLNPQISPALEGIIVKAIDKDPDFRYHAARELGVDLERLTMPMLHTRPQQKQATLRRWVLGAGSVALALMLTTWLLGERFGWWPAAVDAQAVLILPFEVRGQFEGADYLGRAFAEALAVDLAGSASLHVLPVPETRELGSAGVFQRARAARRMHARLLLAGALVRHGDKLQASLSLTDALQNRIRWGTQMDGTGRDLPVLAAALARAAAVEMGAAETHMYESPFIRIEGPPEMTSRPEFAEAVGALRSGRGDALEATERLVRDFPDEPGARLLRVFALGSEAFFEPTGSPKLRAEEEALAALDRVDPKNPWPDLLRAISLGNAGRYDEALQRFQSVLARTDLTAAARALILGFRVSLNRDRGDLQAAVSDGEAAVRLDPANPVGLSELSTALERLGRWDEATDRARRALALDTSSELGQFRFGECLMRLGQWEKAAQLLAGSCERLAFPDCPTAQAARSVVLHRAGKKAEAASLAAQAEGPDGSVMRDYALAIYYLATGDRAGAIRRLRGNLERGYLDADLERDPNLLLLQDDPGFRSLAEKMKERLHGRPPMIPGSR